MLISYMSYCAILIVEYCVGEPVKRMLRQSFERAKVRVVGAKVTM